MKKKGIGTLIFYILIFAVGLYLFSNAAGGGLFGEGNTKRVSYSELKTYISDNEISSMEIQMGINSTCYIKAQYKDEEKGFLTTYAPYNDLLVFLDEYSQTDNSIAIKTEYAILAESDIGSIIMITLTIAALGLFFFFFISQQGGGNGKVMSFGKSKAVMFTRNDKSVTFEDVAGADEEKEELAEIVDFLKYPEKYMKLGARIPKGVLLVGSPGTGKTLLARAVAGEAGVPFFTISGSDFVEMFVGVGASRVRDLFDTAKKNAPCIVFMDEIDAVGRQRGAGLGGGNDEREQTLNQLLVEMDGFNDHQGIIIIAATNRPDILDPALMRPGRFDRQITVNAPDVKGREEILKVHSKNKQLSDDVDLKLIAKQTAGFTGADLENVMNEGALLAARENKQNINNDDIEEAIKRVIAGPEKKSSVVTENDKKITACHEVGHAVVAILSPGAQEEVHGITIIPRGMAAGTTFTLPVDDDRHVSKNFLLSKITMLLGGRAAESVLLDDICTGASNDLERATKIARSMVVELGMSEKIGPVSYGDSSENVFIGRDMMKSKDYSEKVAADIDAEIKRIVSECYEKAKNLISENKDKVASITQTLIEKESLSGEEFKNLFNKDTYAIAETAESIIAE